MFAKLHVAILAILTTTAHQPYTKSSRNCDAWGVQQHFQWGIHLGLRVEFLCWLLTAAAFMAIFSVVVAVVGVGTFSLCGDPLAAFNKQAMYNVASCKCGFAVFSLLCG